MSTRQIPPELEGELPSALTASRSFEGGGELGELIRQLDWGSTPLGPMDAWSPALRRMVRFLVENRLPMLLWWGPEYVCIYNDPYRSILGAKHPAALGKPVREVWCEIWQVLKPLIDTPYRGGPSTWNDDIELHIRRHGYLEESHFTIAYSPVPDDTAPNGIGGVLATVVEITEKVVGERRLRLLRDLGARTADSRTAEEACARAVQTLGTYPKDVPFALLYLVDGDGSTARLAGTGGDCVEPVFAPERVPLVDRAVWPFLEAARTSRGVQVRELARGFDTVPPGPWSDPPNDAFVLALPSSNPAVPSGFLVVGVSSRLTLDEPYRDFLELVRARIGAAIASARALEEEHRRAEALAPGEPVPRAVTPADQRRALAQRVLVVDDNHDAAETLGMLLELLGAESLVVHHGEAALSALKSFRPSAVLLDIGLPGMDGHQVARRMRAEPEGRDVTLIALTGWGQAEDRRRSKEAGMDYHLVKPVDLATLQSTLAMA